jgi:hypothetical protein
MRPTAGALAVPGELQGARSAVCTGTSPQGVGRGDWKPRGPLSPQAAAHQGLGGTAAPSLSFRKRHETALNPEQPKTLNSPRDR